MQNTASPARHVDITTSPAMLQKYLPGRLQALSVIYSDRSPVRVPCTENAEDMLSHGASRRCVCGLQKLPDVNRNHDVEERQQKSVEDRISGKTSTTT